MAAIVLSSMCDVAVRLWRRCANYYCADGRLKRFFPLFSLVLPLILSSIGPAKAFDQPLFSSIASQRVSALSPSNYSCGEVAGKVFHDLNRDGDNNDNEPGLPGIVLVSFKGLQVTTDKHGFFHVGCVEISNTSPNSTFIMKIDPQSLPLGIHLADEGLSDVLLTPGKEAELNIGVILRSNIHFDVTSDAFEDGSTKLKEKWLVSISKLIGVLSAGPSALQVTYHASKQKEYLSRQRISKLEKLIEGRWKEINGRSKLPINMRIAASND
jgi:hypothetical protein